MSWHLFLTAIFTVIIFNHGQTSGKELSLPMEKMSDISILDNVIQVSGVDDTLNMHDSQVENEHFRYVRAVDENTGTKEKLNKILPSEIFQSIMAALKLVNMSMTEDLVRRFVCRINVTKVSDINENVLQNAINLMDKDINTCPLNETIVLIEKIFKMVIQGKLPATNNLVDILNKTIHTLLSPEDIAQMTNSRYGFIYLVFQRMMAALKLDNMNMAEDLVKRFVCRINVTKVSDINENVLKNAINLMDKDINTCPLNKTIVLTEQIIKRIEGKITAKNNLVGLYSFDILKLFAEIIGIPDTEIADVAAFINKTNLHYWTIANFGELLLCHLPVTNFVQIDYKVVMRALMTLMTKPECSNDLLTKKWSELINSFTNSLLKEIGSSLDTLTVMVMDKMKTVNWREIKENIFQVIKEIDVIANKIIANVNKSSDKDWTLKDLLKNFVCGLNITDLNIEDKDFLEKMLYTTGNLDVCTKNQQEEAWEKFLHATVTMYSIQLNEILKELNTMIGNVAVSDILKYFTDEQIKFIKSVFSSVKGLDTLIEPIWSNLKNNPNQTLNVKYIQRFMICNLKTSEIPNMDISKLMNIVAKFGQPVTCPNSNYSDWLVDFIKLLLKLQYEMTFDELNNFIGVFNTKDLKDIAAYIENLNKLAMTSLYKINDEWISYIKQNNSVFNITTFVRPLVCFIGNFSSIDTTITSVGEFGKCTESENTYWTKKLLNSLDEWNDGKIIKEFLIGFGILSGKFEIMKIQNLVTKLMKLYLLKIWNFIPQQIKYLTIAKIDEILMCALKAVTWPIFGQPNAPDFRTCFYNDETINPEKPDKKDGGKLENRYKVGKDFPFEKMLANEAKPEMLLQRLLTFTREPYTEKEERIITFVTKKVIRYLVSNPDKLIKILNLNKDRILELASSVNQVDQIIPMIKMDSETLPMLKNIKGSQKASKLLKKALKDMKIETKSVDEKKDFIRNIPNNILRKSGTKIVDTLFSEETKNLLIQSFKKKRESTSEEMTNEEEEGEKEESLAKLSLVNKLMDITSENEMLALIMDTSLVSVISINMLKKVSPKEMCSMKADTMALKIDQIQYLVNLCPESVANNAKTNATKLGKITTKVTKRIVTSLNLNELINLTLVACRYEKILDIDLEKVLKEHYIAKKLDPMKNGTSMFCVLKHVKTNLPWQQPEAIKICKILGNSMLEKIPPKQAEFFKSKCMVLLKNRNITFADMGSMNDFLEVADIQNLQPEIILQGAVVLGRYIWKPSVFNEIGKKLSDIPSLKQRSNLTSDQVAQINIFSATWNDSGKILKASVLQNYDSLAQNANLLQKKKIICLKENKDDNKCNVMDPIIKNVIQIITSALSATNNRPKRSTTDSCQCSNIVSLGTAAVQMSATQMSGMICASNFDECIEELSEITDWNQKHRQVFVKKAIEIWGQPTNWNSSNMAIASAVIPGLSKDQIKMLTLDSMDTIFYLGKQNNWEAEKLTEIFVLFLKNLKNNNISSITSFDLQTLGNIVCGISPGNIQLIPTLSYINAASQIGNLKICSQSQQTAWSKKALAVYGTDVNTWELAEIASIGSVINGFSTADLQKLNAKQIAAISRKTIPMILPQKLASLHPTQIGYLTTSQVQMVTSAQKTQMTEEQRSILYKKMLGAVTNNPNNNNNNNNNSGGQKVESSYFKLSMLLLISGNFFNPSIWF